MPRADAIITRSVRFAFLFGPPRSVSREEASALHGRLCDDLRLDDIAFRYSRTSPDARDQGGFKALYERPEGRGGLQVILENSGPEQPLRLFIGYNWPPALEHTSQTFDIVSGATFEVLRGPWTFTLAEARLRAESASRNSDNSASHFLSETLVRVPDSYKSIFGEVPPFLSFGIEAPAGYHGDDTLADPKREFRIEVLRENPSSLYSELMCQWPQLPEVVPSDIPSSELLVRRIDRRPSEYVHIAYDNLTRCIRSLAHSPQED